MNIIVTKTKNLYFYNNGIRISKKTAMEYAVCRETFKVSNFYKSQLNWKGYFTTAKGTDITAFVENGNINIEVKIKGKMGMFKHESGWDFINDEGRKVTFDDNIMRAIFKIATQQKKQIKENDELEAKALKNFYEEKGKAQGFEYRKWYKTVSDYDLCQGISRGVVIDDQFIVLEEIKIDDIKVSQKFDEFNRELILDSDLAIELIEDMRIVGQKREKAKIDAQNRPDPNPYLGVDSDGDDYDSHDKFCRLELEEN